MNRVSTVLCGFSLLASAAVAADQGEQVPALEFLEFLGEWSEDDQAWLDTQQQQEDTEQTHAQTEVNVDE